MDNYGQIDGNITFIVNDNFNIVMDFINLNDEVTYTYERNEYAPTGLYQNGRRFYLGIRYSL
jgi:iron complex outermembrane recepter protein